MKYVIMILIFVVTFGVTWCLCKAAADADKKLIELEDKENL